MDRYNGWRNYETWVVNLWLSNEESTYEYWRLIALEVWLNAKATDFLNREQAARHELAERLKDEIEEYNPCSDACLYSDLLNAAISEVDWHEVADSFLEGIPGSANENQGSE